METIKKIKILFIDDEINNLHAFKAAFRFDYDITTVSSADEAENWLNHFMRSKNARKNRG